VCDAAYSRISEVYPESGWRWPPCPVGRLKAPPAQGAATGIGCAAPVLSGAPTFSRRYIGPPMPLLLIPVAPPRHRRELTSLHNVCAHNGARLAVA
jgi:hypothetical protein